MTNQKSEDLLFELCKPYLLSLSSLITESLRYPDEPASDLADDEKYPHFHAEVLSKISSLTYADKARVLLELTTWIDSAVKDSN